MEWSFSLVDRDHRLVVVGCIVSSFLFEMDKFREPHAALHTPFRRARVPEKRRHRRRLASLSGSRLSESAVPARKCCFVQACSAHKKSTCLHQPVLSNLRQVNTCSAPDPGQHERQYCVLDLVQHYSDTCQGREEKAQRYIALLDEARANTKWSEVPELIRKVTKHAPQRKCKSGRTFSN